MAIDDLQAKIRKLKSPMMLSLCPLSASMPVHLMNKAIAQYGQTLQAVAQCYYRFCEEILHAMQDIFPAVSIETGCFSALGAEGVAVMQRVLQLAKELGYYVLLDLMRCDLPPAAEEMAQACFGGISVGTQTLTPYPCDGVLLSAAIGSDGIKPYADYIQSGKNVFLLARTSNKSAREVQDLMCGDRMAYQVPADLALRWSQEQAGKYGYCEIGIVAGLTNPSALQSLRKKYDKLFFLVPGLTTQGGHIKDTALCFDKLGHGGMILVGRSILYAYQKKETDGSDFAQQAKNAALSLREQILGYTMVI